MPQSSVVPGAGGQAERVRALAEEVRRMEGARRPAAEVVVSTGMAALDRSLPERGLRRGTLVEWLAGGGGSGAATLALRAACQATLEGGALVVVDSQGRFYPPAAMQWGVELDQLIVVRPQRAEDHAWAVDQALRCPGVAAVWCAAGDQNEHTLRRWQLAAESSGALGMLLRGQRARGEPSWAELRLWVEPIPSPPRSGRNRRVRVELLRCRGGSGHAAVELEMARPTSKVLETLSEPVASRWDSNHETRPVHLAPSVAAAKARRRARGA